MMLLETEEEARHRQALSFLSVDSADRQSNEVESKLPDAAKTECNNTFINKDTSSLT